MKCELHNQPRRMTCARCDDLMCSMCAEFIDGSWFCPECATEERRITSGLEYYRIAAGLQTETFRDVDIREYETLEV